jgi:hypothetical protein
MTPPKKILARLEIVWDRPPTRPDVSEPYNADRKPA